MTKELITSERIDIFLSPKAFWDFSVKLYSQPKVQNILLKWQDELGANVNEVLFILWCNRQKISFQEDMLETVIKSNKYLNRVTNDFRHSRRMRYLELSNGINETDNKELISFKKKLLDLELYFESMQQKTLLRATCEQTFRNKFKKTRVNNINHLLKAYLTHKKIACSSKYKLCLDIEYMVKVSD